MRLETAADFHAPPRRAIHLDARGHAVDAAGRWTIRCAFGDRACGAGCAAFEEMNTNAHAVRAFCNAGSDGGFIIGEFETGRKR